MVEISDESCFYVHLQIEENTHAHSTISHSSPFNSMTFCTLKVWVVLLFFHASNKSSGAKEDIAPRQTHTEHHRHIMKRRKFCLVVCDHKRANIYCINCTCRLNCAVSAFNFAFLSFDQNAAGCALLAYGSAQFNWETESISLGILLVMCSGMKCKNQTELCIYLWKYASELFLRLVQVCQLTKFQENCSFSNLLKLISL